jgi:two-component sensor histidine kinase
MDDIGPLTLRGRMTREMRGISFQLAIVLSIAVLPLSVIAIWQSMEFARESRRSAEVMLMGMTAENVELERSFIEAGLSLETSLVTSAMRLGTDQAECMKMLAGFITGQPAFRSIRFVPLDGVSLCASDGKPSDLQTDAAHVRFLANPVPTVDRGGPDDDGLSPTLRVLLPIWDNGTLLGHLTIVLQSFHLPPTLSHFGVPTPLEVVLLNQEGTLLTSTLDVQTASRNLPETAKLDEFLNGPDGFFAGMDRSGRELGFVRVSLFSNTVVALGIWPKDNPVSQNDGALSKAITYPLLTWLASIATALFAARRLVIRPIKLLRDEMRRFALGQRNDAIVLAPGAALEIQEAVNTFNKLELIVARNEAALALTAEGKLLLLREVHHRIKNNLQMISSIISIQRRKTSDPEVERVLRSLRDRVLSIAAVDQSLYTNGDIVDVRADLLIASITDRLVGVNLEPGHNVQVTTRFQMVMLHADQIGPLSLLANEGITNALKYVGRPDGGRASIAIVLDWDDDLVHLSITNSLGSGSNAADSGRESTKLGMILIDAFADQLAAEVQSGPDPGGLGFHLSVRFRPNGSPMAQNPAPGEPGPLQAAIADDAPL